MNLNTSNNRTVFLLLFLLSMLTGQFAFSACYTNADLNCKGTDIAWPSKGLVDRVGLFFDPEVQRNFTSCALFAQVLKTECQLQSALQGIFVPPTTTEKNQILVSTPNPKLFSDISTLPLAFRNYFNSVPLSRQAQLNLDEISSLIDSNLKSRIESFISDNVNNILEIPYACNPGLPKRSYCGFEVSCVSLSNPRVGDKIVIKKISPNTCSGDYAYSVIQSSIFSLADFSRLNEFNVNQQAVSNFSGFGDMPLINQVDGWVQGLSIQKYGVNYVTPGICLASSNSMLAIGLRSESDGARLRNLFDSTLPVQPMSVRNGGSASSSINLRYGNHASHVDEMLRSAGIVNRFPNNPLSYTHFFNNGRTTAPNPPPALTLYGQYAIFWEDYYDQFKPTQDFFESNFQSWMSQGTGFTVGLQSTGSSPNRATDPIVGHQTAVNAVSGSNLILMDPWNVVSHVKFDQVTIAPDVPDIVINPADVAICRRPYANRLAGQCAEFLSNINAPYVTIAYMGPCAYTGPSPIPITAISQRVYDGVMNGTFNPSVTFRDGMGNIIYTKTVAQLCPTAITRQLGEFRLVRHVGGQAGYVGTPTTSGDATSSLVTSFTTAERWPRVTNNEEIRNENIQTYGNSPQTYVSPETQNTCGPLTQGTVVINGESYNFRNPTSPRGSSISTFTSCLDLSKVGSLDANQTSNFLGSIQYSCNNGLISVSSHSCEVLRPSTCSVVDGSGYSVPFIEKINGSAVIQFSSCTVTSCLAGTQVSEDRKKCECKGADPVTGIVRSGEFISEGWPFSTRICQFANLTTNPCSTLAPVGRYVLSAGSKSGPYCIDSILDNKFITSSNPSLQMSQSLKYANLIDESNRTWDQFEPNAIYILNKSTRKLEFSSCTNGMSPTTGSCLAPQSTDLNFVTNNNPATQLNSSDWRALLTTQEGKNWSQLAANAVYYLDSGTGFLRMKECVPNYRMVENVSGEKFCEFDPTQAQNNQIKNIILDFLADDGPQLLITAPHPIAKNKCTEIQVTTPILNSLSSNLNIQFNHNSLGDMYSDSNCTVQSYSVNINRTTGPGRIWFKNTLIEPVVITASAQGHTTGTHRTLTRDEDKIILGENALSYMSSPIIFDGRVFTQGQNYGGYIGIGTNNPGYLNQWTEILFPTAHRIVQMVSGFEASCGLNELGQVYCWGNNLYKSLGNLSTTSTQRPSVLLNLPKKALSIAMGPVSACAVLEDFELFCWGTNQNGILGLGTNATFSVPQRVKGVGYEVIQISLGYDHACSLSYDGIVKCWGNNNQYQLGDGTSENKNQAYSQVPLSSPATKIVAGHSQSCAILNTGEIECWGTNSSGERGNGSFTENILPTKVNLSGQMALDITRTAKSICAVLVGGDVTCWGTNWNTVLGLGLTDFSPISFPTRVPLLSPTHKIGTITSDGVCTVSEDERIFCWGNSTRNLSTGKHDWSSFAQVPVPTKNYFQLQLSSELGHLGSGCTSLDVLHENRGNLVNTTTVYNLILADHSNRGRFYSDSSCSSQISNLNFEAGRNKKTVFYKLIAPSSSSSVIHLSASANSSTVSDSVIPLRLSGPGRQFVIQPHGELLTSGNCVKFTLSSLDESGSPALPPGATYSVGVSGLSFARMYSNATCTSSISNITFSAGQTEKDFYLSDNRDDTLNLRFSYGTISGGPYEFWVGCGLDGSACP